MTARPYTLSVYHHTFILRPPPHLPTDNARVTSPKDGFVPFPNLLQTSECRAVPQRLLQATAAGSRMPALSPLTGSSAGRARGRFPTKTTSAQLRAPAARPHLVPTCRHRRINDLVSLTPTSTTSSPGPRPSPLWLPLPALSSSSRPLLLPVVQDPLALPTALTPANASRRRT
jgi:hypothetical protein